MNHNGIGATRGQAIGSTADARAIWLKAASLIAALAFAFGLALLAPAAQAHADEPSLQTDVSKLQCDNWMSGISGDYYLHQFTIPGTHDSSMKDAHANGSLTSLPANAFAGAAETQGLYLYEQLNAGARIFDIRLTDEAPYGNAQDGKSVWLCHGPSPLNVVCSFTYYARDKDKNYLTFENAMTYFTDFLKAHPTETIIMQVTNEHGTGDKASILRRAKATLDKWKATKNPTTGSSYIYTESDSKNTIDKMPKLRDVRGKIVVVSDVAGSLGYGMSFSTDNNWGWSTMGGVKFSYENHYSTDNESKVKYLEALYKGTAAKDYDKFANNPQMRAVTSKFSQPASDKNTGVFVYLSSNKFGKGGWWPKSIALWVNPRIVSNNIGVSKDDSKYSGKGLIEESRGQYFGWVNTDYFNDQIGRAIWMTNFPTSGLEYATVSFDANGGSGTMNPVVVQKDSSFVLPAGTFKGPNDEVLKGWKVGNEVKAAGTSITVSADTTITAQWGMPWSALKKAIDESNKSKKPVTVDMLTDIVAGPNDSLLIVEDGADVTINMNGHTIDRAAGKYGKTGTRVFAVLGKLTLNGMGTGTTVGTVTGGNCSDGSGIRIGRGGVVTLNSVSVTGNVTPSSGGGVCVAEPEPSTVNIPGKLIVTGKTSIQGNTCVKDGKTTPADVRLERRATVEVGDAGLDASARIGIASTRTPTPEGPIVLTNDLRNKATLSNFVDQGAYGYVQDEGTGALVVRAMGKVTFLYDNGSEATTQMVKIGEKLPKPADPVKAGYTFNGWIKNSTGAAYNFDDPVTDDFLLKATWKASEKPAPKPDDGGNTPGEGGGTDDGEDPGEGEDPGKGGETEPAVTHTVTFNANGGNMSATTATVQDGQQASEPAAPTRAHHHFLGWFTDTACTNYFNFTTPITADVTLYAGWDLEQHTVTFAANGGVGDSFQIVDYGTTASAPNPAPTREGHTLVAWCTDETGAKTYDFATPVESDIVLYAKWERRSYTVTFDVNGGSGAPAAQSVLYEGLVTAPATEPTRFGYDFGGWYAQTDSEVDTQTLEMLSEDPDFSSMFWVTDDGQLRFAYAFDINTVTSDTTLYARWIPHENTVRFIESAASAPDGNEFVVREETVLSGDFADDSSAPSSESRTFAGWYADEGLTTPFDFEKPILESTTVYGKWVRATYTVEFDSMGGSQVAPASQQVEFESMAKQPSNPTRKGYAFRGWYQDLTGLVTTDTIADVKSQILDLYEEGSDERQAMQKYLNEGFVTEGERIYMVYEPQADQVLSDIHAQALWKPVIVKNETDAVNNMTYKVTKVATSNAAGTVTLVKTTAKAAKSGKVTIPKTIKLRDGKAYKVTVVAAGAFKGLAKVKRVVVGANVTTVQAKAFKNLKRLEKVTLGASVKKVAAGAFKNTPKLKTIVVKSTKLAKKARVAGMLKGSKVKQTVRVKVPAAKRAAYARVLTRANLGSPKNVIVK